MNKLFAVIFLFLIISVISEESNVWISFKEYFFGKKNRSDNSPDLANIISAPCRSGYARVGRMCRKVYKGVR